MFSELLQCPRPPRILSSWQWCTQGSYGPSLVERATTSTTQSRRNMSRSMRVPKLIGGSQCNGVCSTLWWVSCWAQSFAIFSTDDGGFGSKPSFARNWRPRFLSLAAPLCLAVPRFHWRSCEQIPLVPIFRLWDLYLSLIFRVLPPVWSPGLRPRLFKQAGEIVARSIFGCSGQ